MLTDRVLSVSPLLLARAITVSFLNPFRRAKAEVESGSINVQVKWGRERSVNKLSPFVLPFWSRCRQDWFNDISLSPRQILSVSIKRKADTKIDIMYLFHLRL